MFFLVYYFHLRFSDFNLSFFALFIHLVLSKSELKTINILASKCDVFYLQNKQNKHTLQKIVLITKSSHASFCIDKLTEFVGVKTNVLLKGQNEKGFLDRWLASFENIAVVVVDSILLCCMCTCEKWCFFSHFSIWPYFTMVSIRHAFVIFEVSQNHHDDACAQRVLIALWFAYFNRKKKQSPS